MRSSADEIDLSENVLDSREVEARIDWLEGQAESAADPDLPDDLRPEPLTEDEQEELTALRELRDGLQGYAGDWIHGATLVNEDYKKEYAREYAEDISEIPDALISYIDWDKWADDFYDYDWTEATVTLYCNSYTFLVRG